MENFLDLIVQAYKQESNSLGFVPISRIKRDIALGRFFRNENGFVYIGSPKSEFTPIHAVYIYPEKRNGSTDKVKQLLCLLPNKKYRVRCCFGESFWKKMGLKRIGIDNKNTRKRNIFILQGFITRNSNYHSSADFQLSEA